MIYEVCEIITRHLRDGEHGVNTLRLSVPLDPNDPPLEQIVTVKSEFEFPYLPGGRIPESVYDDGPLVLVRRGDEMGEFSTPGSPEIDADRSHCAVAIPVFFPRRSARDLHQENRCLSALLRVVRRSVGALMEVIPVEQRNCRDVQLTDLVAPPRLIPTVVYVGEQDVAAGAVLLDCYVLDRWAEGITS